MFFLHTVFQLLKYIGKTQIESLCLNINASLLYSMNLGQRITLKKMVDSVS